MTRTAPVVDSASTGFPAFSSAEYERRYRELDRLLERSSLDALVLYGRSRDRTVHWLTNWLTTIEAIVVWVPGEDPTLLVQLGNHLETARRMSVVPDIRFAGAGAAGQMDSRQALLDTLRERGLSRAAIGIAGGISHRHVHSLRNAFEGAQLTDVTREVAELQLTKSDEEFERIERAAALADASILALRDQLRPGLRETHLPRIIQDAYLDDGGYNQIHFAVATSMTDPDAAAPAQWHRDREIQAGDAVVVEISAGWWGYSGQALRTYTVGGPPTDLYAEMHDVAMEAFYRTEMALRPGATIEEIHGAGEVIHERGFTILDDFLHGANQSTPIVRTRATTRGAPEGFTFKPGMAVVVQPNVVTGDGRAGVQFGEMLRITESGAVRLHAAPHALFVCASPAAE
jgi:Xaa-Pro dipeptidase